MENYHLKNMVVTDLDGTLLQSNKKISNTDLHTLRFLGEKNILRVIATGRSLFSAQNVLPDDFPIDCLVFSSGAGIVEWSTKCMVKKHAMTVDEVKKTVRALMDLGADFMIHEPIPNNHFFVYYHTGRLNPDFLHRCEMYKEFANRQDFKDYKFHEACQVLAIEPYGNGKSDFTYFKELLSPLKVIQTTSPFDGRSTWIEIFPSGVSKALAAEWVGKRHGINRKGVLGVGNDYNDLDLLAWVQSGILVGNAPEELKRKFQTVSSNNENGFTEAVNNWLRY